MPMENGKKNINKQRKKVEIWNLVKIRNKKNRINPMKNNECIVDLNSGLNQSIWNLLNFY
jgi:hypothetical protein